MATPYQTWASRYQAPGLRSPAWYMGEQGLEAEVNRGSAEYARWIQSSLNQIMGTRLVVDGIIGTQTRSAIRSFQSQAGVAVDGVVGPITEAAMIAAGAPQPPGTSAAPGTPAPPSSGIDTALPSSGPGFYSYTSADKRYALPDTIAAVRAIALAWQAAHPNGPRLGIGDISLKGGGPFPPHSAHQKGLEVDIRPVRNDGQEAPVTYTDRAYSRSLTQDLVNRIIGNGVLRVQSIFFNDPAVTSVRALTGHDNHLHAQFYAPPGGIW